MNIDWPQYRGSVISARYGPFIHTGILHSVQNDGRVWVIDNKPAHVVAYRTLEEFSGGGNIRLEVPVQDSQMADLIISRAESQLGRRYDLLTFNCEHFVTLALGLEPQSQQLQNWALLGFGLLLVGIVAKLQPGRTRRRFF